MPATSRSSARLFELALESLQAVAQLVVAGALGLQGMAGLRAPRLEGRELGRLLLQLRFHTPRLALEPLRVLGIADPLQHAAKLAQPRLRGGPLVSHPEDLRIQALGLRLPPGHALVLERQL